jgi:hypothetical protein
MPTTTHYGWDTPANTDYVTNGALAIRTMAQDADDTVYSIDQAKVAKAGDTMSGDLQMTASNQVLFGDSYVEGITAGTAASAYAGIGTGWGSYLRAYGSGQVYSRDASTIRPIPFATAAGKANFTGSVSITFPSGRFIDDDVMVQATMLSATASAGFSTTIGTVDRYGTTLYAWKLETTGTPSIIACTVARTVYWQATQMYYYAGSG